jgi:hypothetical protein
MIPVPYTFTYSSADSRAHSSPYSSADASTYSSKSFTIIPRLHWNPELLWLHIGTDDVLIPGTNQSSHASTHSSKAFRIIPIFFFMLRERE